MLNTLRHDLLTSGWSMINSQQWVVRLNDCWYEFASKKNPGPVFQAYSDEMSWLLHEALSEEWFYLENVEMRAGAGSFHWHIDGGYLRVLFAIQGDGTIAALGYENNIATPPGYALIMTGQQRMWKTGIRETWHTPPHRYEVVARRLVLLNFRNAE